jgi:prevent-host-death family protein
MYVLAANRACWGNRRTGGGVIGMHADDTKAVRKYTVTEARNNFKDVVDGVVYTRRPAIVTKHGGESVAVVPYDLLELFTRIEAIMDLSKASKALDDFDKNGGTTLEDFKKELGIKDD